MQAASAAARDVSKLKFIGSMFCEQYQSDAKFYVDEAHTSGLRHLIVVYDRGGYAGVPYFAAVIPTDWDAQAVQNLILWPIKDPNAPYPSWEVPARVFGSPTLSEWWKGAPLSGGNWRSAIAREGG